MEALKDILPQFPQKMPKSLKHLLHLPSTAEIEGQLAQCKASPYEAHHAKIEHLQSQLADAQRRDEIAKTRPEGCWCLGLGGMDEYSSRSGQTYFNKTCSCPEGQAVEKHRHEVLGKEKEIRERQRIENLWAGAQIPVRFTDMRLGTSPLVKSHPALITRLTIPHDVFLDYPNADPPDDIADPYFAAINAWWGASYFIYGPFGVGKTCLAVALARARVEWEGGEWDERFLDSFLFTTTPRMLSELRSTYNRSRDEDIPTEQEVIDKYAQVSLLILDDLGAEQVKTADWVGDRLYQIIGERHAELRPTIFTSNLPLDTLAKRIGERITWRIVEMVGKDNIIHLSGPNLRD